MCDTCLNMCVMLCVGVCNEGLSPGFPADSGYPGSISSSSSQGQKSLKSPPDVSPSFNFPTYFTSTTTVADKNEASRLPPPSSSRPPPVLEHHCRGSINTAELGLFSPEVIDDAHIANFPMPPDPQWVWSAMGAIGVGPESDGLLGQHHHGGGGLDSASETTTQSLFDPSKMVIAKVESLSDDSQFNDYLNEILGSEEVMECLNSISAEPFPVVPMELKQIGPAPTTEVSVGSQVTVLAAGGGAADKGVESAVVTVTASSTAVVESSQPTAAVPPVSAGVCTSGSTQSSSETVAAYVAAETSVMPFSVGDCFTAPEVNVATAASEAVAPLTSSAQENLPTQPNLITVPSTLASLRCGDLAPRSNVMWSQSGTVEEEPSLKPPEANETAPLEIKHKSTSGSPVCESSGDVLQGTVHQPVSQSTPVVPTATRTANNSGESITPPLQPPAEPLQEKKQIVRIKRKKVVKTATESDKNGGKAAKTANESSVSGGEAGKAAASLKEGGRGPDKKDKEKDELSSPPEVKSRTGRAIKPSWKVAQQASSTQGLKRTNSPSSVVPTKSNGEGGDDVRAGDRVGKVVKKGRPRIVKTSTAKSSATSASSSLSLADVVEGGLKKLPDLPANTLVSPNPTVSLPTTSGTLSMSLDDILRQMNDDESQGVPVGSLLSTGVTGPTGNDSEDGEGRCKDLKEKATGVPLKEEERSERGASRVPIKPARVPSPIRWTEDDNASPVPQTATQHREPGSTSEASGNPMPPPSARDIHLQMQGKAAETVWPRSPDYIKRPLNPFMLRRIDQLGPTGVDDSPQLWGETLPNLLVEPDEEDDCCAVMMDLSSSGDEAEPMPGPRTPSAPPPEQCGKTLSLWSPSTPSHTPPEVSCEALDEGAEEEDQIDIFADDVDAFTVYTMEEKAKKATPPRMPSPPSEFHKF